MDVAHLTPPDALGDAGPCEAPLNRTHISVIIAVAALACCVPLWVTPWVPSQDGPQHLLWVQVLAHLNDPGTAYHRHFTEGTRWLSLTLSERALVLVLKAGVGFLDAQRLYLTTWVMAMAASMAWAFSWSRPQGALRAVPGLMLVHGFALSMGFWNYMWSLPFALVALGVVLRNSKGTAALVVLSATLLLSALHHPFVPTMLVPALVLLSWAAGGPFVRVGLACVPAIAVEAASVLSFVGHQAGPPSEVVWTPLQSRVQALTTGAFSGIAPGGALGVIGVGVVILLGVSVRSSRSRTVLVQGTCALGYGLLTLLSPIEAFGWAFFLQRFVPLAWLLALSASAAEPLRAARVAAVVCGAALLGQLAVTSAVNRQLGDNIAELTSVAGTIPLSSRILPVTFDPGGESANGLIRPYLNAPAYLVMERGGMTPYAFATLPLHAILFKDAPPAPGEFFGLQIACPRHGLAEGSDACALHTRGAAEELARNTAYDVVVTWKAPSGFQQGMEGSGFRLAQSTEHVQLFMRR